MASTLVRELRAVIVLYLIEDWSLSCIHVEPRPFVQLGWTTSDCGDAQDFDWIRFQIHKNCLQGKHNGRFMANETR